MVSPHRRRRSRSRDKRPGSRDQFKRSRRSSSRDKKRSPSKSLKSTKRHKHHKDRDNNKSLRNRGDKVTEPTIYYNQKSDKKSPKNIVPPLPNADILDAKTLAEQEEMKKLLGFASFDTSKGKHVEGNVEFGECSNIIKKRKYRQYMNRKGGFNRPLDYVV
ncbi:unnamed protein product [Gordionus sp. m RMFG-2023]|uniref:U4/U6.U5 small nuclear ribonucleoprotein 27 kDa protein-like n=1 Tax=Gordionus sp. m RMFG-2023 TaxID=3053472 RepID=UPI0030E5CF1E